MTKEFFVTQTGRLRTRFGDRAFDQEFIHLVWREVHDMSEHAFSRFCDVMIGSRTPLKPPLLSEFREARLNEQKLKFDNDVKAAAQGLRRAPAEMKEHMRKILSAEYGAVGGVKEAFEIARLRRLTDDDREGA